MNEFKTLMESERTIKGYDVVKALETAFRFCKEYMYRKEKLRLEVTDIAVRILMRDELYEKLHRRAKDDYESSVGAGRPLDERLSEALDDLG